MAFSGATAARALDPATPLANLAHQSWTTENGLPQNTVQALANGIVRALKWLQQATPEEVAKTVPKEYLLGEPEVYLAALRKSRSTYSVDGVFPAAGAQAYHDILATFDPAVKAAGTLDVRQTYDNSFVKK